YSYVFLLGTESFAQAGRRQLEACRSLGCGPWSAFLRVALPMALPANADEPGRASAAVAADHPEAGRCQHRSLLAHLS
ncbi:MAG: hypothetical protein ACK5SU_08830, partial [Phenylobacterium sp.]